MRRLAVETGCESLCRLRQFRMPETAHNVVIHHASGLHMGVANGRADEFKTARLEVFAHGVGLLSFRRNLLAGFPVIDFRRAVGELPYILVECPEFFLGCEEGFGVGDGGGDFQAIANDTGIGHQFRGFRFGIARDFFWIKLVKGFAKIFTLLQHAIPTQASLHAFENKKFEELAIVVKRHAPLLVVIRDIKVVGRPGAACHNYMLGRANGGDEVADFLVVLFTGCGFHAAGNIDRERHDFLHGTGNVLGR